MKAEITLYKDNQKKPVVSVDGEVLQGNVELESHATPLGIPVWTITHNGKSVFRATEPPEKVEDESVFRFTWEQV